MSEQYIMRSELVDSLADAEDELSKCRQLMSADAVTIRELRQQRDSANEAMLAATQRMNEKDIEIDRLKYTQQKAIELAVKWEEEVEDLREKLAAARAVLLPGTYVCCGSHYYACVRGDEECPTCLLRDERDRLRTTLEEIRDGDCDLRGPGGQFFCSRTEGDCRMCPACIANEALAATKDVEKAGKGGEKP